MDCLELVVGDGELDEQRQSLFARVQAPLERVEAVAHRTGRRRHEAGVANRCTRGANEVLDVAELAGAVLSTAHPFHQLTVQLANEAQRHRQLRPEAVAHRAHVVHDLLGVADVFSGIGRASEFGKHELFGRGDGPLDAAREDRLAMEQRRANQERIDRAADSADKAADRVLRISKQPDGDVVQRQLARHRVGDERWYARRDVDQPAGAFGREIGSTHVILGSVGIGGVILGFESNLK